MISRTAARAPLAAEALGLLDRRCDHDILLADGCAQPLLRSRNVLLLRSPSTSRHQTRRDVLCPARGVRLGQVACNLGLVLNPNSLDQASRRSRAYPQPYTKRVR